MTYEQVKAAHIEELIALGIRPEDIDMVLAAEERTGHSVADSLRLQQQQPELAQSIRDDAVESGFTYEDDDL